jgi:hypothetical protein
VNASRVLVLGGYGNFGRFIAERLATEGEVVVAGRDGKAAAETAKTISAESMAIDLSQPSFVDRIRESAAGIVVHSAGPFQGQDYRVARAAIECGAHYIDIADAREFVCGIGALDALAAERGVLCVSGASSVPALSSAVVDSLLPSFSRIDEIDVTISASEKVPGLSTVQGVLAYCGKPFTQLRGGRWQVAHGWQGIGRCDFGEDMGTRWTCDCDVPDNDLFPRRYGVRDTVRFRAGVELARVQWGLWLLSWIVRSRMLRDASSLAGFLRNRGIRLERLGTGRSGMLVTVTGIDSDGKAALRTWRLEARRNHGARIPCLAAIALVRKLRFGLIHDRGAKPCVGLVSLHDYLSEARDLEVSAAMLSSSP